MLLVDEMTTGYLDGYKSHHIEMPEFIKLKSPAYKHGWLNGRDDRLGKPRERASVLRRRAEMILN
jgi:hypothetical protein